MDTEADRQLIFKLSSLHRTRAGKYLKRPGLTFQRPDKRGRRAGPGSGPPLTRGDLACDPGEGGERRRPLRRPDRDPLGPGHAEGWTPIVRRTGNRFSATRYPRSAPAAACASWSSPSCSTRRSCAASSPGSSGIFDRRIHVDRHSAHRSKLALAGQPASARPSSYGANYSMPPRRDAQGAAISLSGHCGLAKQQPHSSAPTAPQSVRRYHGFPARPNRSFCGLLSCHPTSRQRGSSNDQYPSAERHRLLEPPQGSRIPGSVREHLVRMTPPPPRTTELPHGPTRDVSHFVPESVGARPGDVGLANQCHPQPPEP